MARISRSLLVLVLAGMAFKVLNAATALKPAVNWSYTGKQGPRHWGELNPDFNLCASGHEQSPIAIPLLPAHLEPQQHPRHFTLELTYPAHLSSLEIINNGHTVQFHTPEPHTLKISEAAGQSARYFYLKQVHFHIPSEHTIGRQHYPLEFHLVHESLTTPKKIMVIAVFGETLGTLKHSKLHSLIAHLPLQPQKTLLLKDPLNNMTAFLPPQEPHVQDQLHQRFIYTPHNYFYYQGSLTTPPCSEGVEWFILDDKLYLTTAELHRLYQLYHHNNRDLQSLHERPVIHDL